MAKAKDTHMEFHDEAPHVPIAQPTGTTVECDGVLVHLTKRAKTATVSSAVPGKKFSIEVGLEGEVYPDKAIDNAVKAVAKKVKNWNADKGDAA